MFNLVKIRELTQLMIEASQVGLQTTISHYLHKKKLSYEFSINSL